MKSITYKWIIIAISAMLFLPALTCAQTKDISGTYSLYREDNPEKTVGSMLISMDDKENNKFSVTNTPLTGDAAIDWQGLGYLEGDKGYYSWEFKDGKFGTTTFTIDKDGTLHGHVSGSGIDWKYIAHKQ